MFSGINQSSLSSVLPSEHFPTYFDEFIFLISFLAITAKKAVAPRTISPGRADFSPGPADLVCDVVQVALLAQLACHPLALPGHLAQRHEDRQDHAARHKVQVLHWDH